LFVLFMGAARREATRAALIGVGAKRMGRAWVAGNAFLGFAGRSSGKKSPQISLPYA
jgi:hypothetical protein